MDRSRTHDPPEPATSSSDTEHQSRSSKTNSTNPTVSSSTVAMDIPIVASAQHMDVEFCDGPAEHTSPSLGDPLDQAPPGSLQPPDTAANIGNDMVDSLPEASDLDDEMLESDSSPMPALATRRGSPSVVAAIEGMIAKIVDSLAQKEELTIELKTKRSPTASRTPGSEQRVAISKIQYPGRNAQEDWKFCTRYYSGSI